MDHVEVHSSQIASIALDPASGVMQTLFRRGGLYEYQGVSAEEFEAVLNPGAGDQNSVSKAFDRVIKRGGKLFRKLESSAPTILDHPTTWPHGYEKTKVVTIDGDVQGESVRVLVPDFEVQVQEVAEVQKKSTELTVQAREIQVVDQRSQTAASDVLLTIASMRREISETFKPMKDAAHRAHKVICDQERAVDAPLAEAEMTLKSRIGSFVQEQRRIALVEEARQREEAQAAAALVAQAAAIDQAIDQAVDLEARGDLRAAAAVLDNPAPVPMRYVAPAAVAPAIAQVKGVSTRLEWDFRIVDINQIPREYLLVNETAIRSAGKNTQGRARIAGVEFFEKPVVAASRGGR